MNQSACDLRVYDALPGPDDGLGDQDRVVSRELDLPNVAFPSLADGSGTLGRLRDRYLPALDPQKRYRVWLPCFRKRRY